MSRILRSHHVLAVHDVDASASYYMATLGFREVLSADGWRFVRRDECLIMLGECPDALPARDLGDHSYFAYLVVDDAAGYLAELRARGVEVIAEIEDKAWGMREFGIRTLDGHRLMIGQDLE